MEHLTHKNSEMSASYESQLTDLEQRFKARLEKEATKHKRKSDALSANVNKVRCNVTCICDHGSTNESYFAFKNICFDRVESPLYGGCKIVNLMQKLTELRYFQTLRG